MALQLIKLTKLYKKQLMNGNLIKYKITRTILHGRFSKMIITILIII